MSLVVAIPNKDAVVLAVDSRTVYRDEKTRAINYYIDDAEKYMILNDTCILAYSCSDTEATNVLLDYISRQRDRELLYVSDIARDISICLRRNLNRDNQYLDKQSIVDNYDLNLLVVGKDIESVSIYELDYRRGFKLEKHSRYVSRGVWELSDYWLNKYWHNDLTINQLQRLAIWNQIETANNNNYVGGPIHVFTIINDAPKTETITIGADDPIRQEVSNFISDLIKGWCNNSEIK